jgi:zinc and cadmium transporter
MPEVVERFGLTTRISLFFIAGMLIFFVLEKFIHWRHCHEPTCKSHPHPLAYMNLVGDSFHNFIDGAVIAGAYLVSVPLGIATTLAVVLHEIPQEIGDFGVLIHAGFTKTKALFMNFVTALTAVLGAVVTLLIASNIHNLEMFLLPFTAGGFIYIAGSDLIPELHKETRVSKSILQLVFIILGVGIMLAMLLLE